MTCELSVQIEEENICVNWLMYKSYEFQRDNAPSIKAERWRLLYINQEIYEKIYQNIRRNHVSIS